jgi:CrcB protein
VDLLVRTGFLGSYTTFSTYGYDTLMLWRNNQPGTTLFYWMGSAILGLLGLGVGCALAQLLVG